MSKPYLTDQDLQYIAILLTEEIKKIESDKNSTVAEVEELDQVRDLLEKVEEMERS